MSEWITDRLPTRKDSYEDSVWVMVMGFVAKNYWYNVELGNAWQPIVIEKPEPYVAPEPKYRVSSEAGRPNQWSVLDGIICIAVGLPTREAAERIAAIYNEVMS